MLKMLEYGVKMKGIYVGKRTQKKYLFQNDSSGYNRENRFKMANLEVKQNQNNCLHKDVTDILGFALPASH